MSRKTDKQQILLFCISIVVSVILLYGIIIIQQVEAQFKPNQSVSVNDEKQVFVTRENIKDYSSKSSYTGIDNEYINFYNATFLFDNLINTYSYLSVKGQDANFNVALKNPLDKPICFANINVFNWSLKTPYQLILTNGSGSIINSGILDEAVKQVRFDDCINNLTNIKMVFNPINNNDFTILSELQLFTDTRVINPPPLQCPEGYHVENDKCVVDDIVKPPPVTPPPPPITEGGGNQTITNSTINLHVSDSKINILPINNTELNLGLPNFTTPQENVTTNIIPTTATTTAAITTQQLTPPPPNSPDIKETPLPENDDDDDNDKDNDDDNDEEEEDDN